MPSSDVCNVNSTIVHGIRLQSPFDVWPGAANAKRQWTHHLNVRVHDELADEAELAGDIVAECVEQGERLYTFSNSGQRTAFTFPGLCQGWFDVPQQTLELHSESMAVAALVLPNTIVAAIAAQLGDLTLHGSAVHWQGRTLAFCGPSTAGKTTCAAALSLLGAAAVSDDLLRVETSVDAAPLCFPGIPEFRLRSTHGWDLPQSRIRTLVDDRTGFTPAHVSHEKSRLHAVIFPLASETPISPEVRRVQGEVAMRRLLQSARLAWSPRGGVTFLRQAAALAGQVQLYDLRIHLASLSTPSYRQQLADVLRGVV
jgi:hypothetical protein